MSHMTTKNINAPERRRHWEGVYRSKQPIETSWYQATPTLSLQMIANTGAGFEEGVIDIGGGASLLVDHLLALGYRDLTVLDLAAEALDQARRRLGPNARRIEWLVADVTEYVPARTFAVWHDRAAFHFLTDPADRERYVGGLSAALEPGGQAIIAAFAPDGPTRCSGLDIVRYDADTLGAVLGAGFRLVEERRESHTTPQGREQRFGFYRFLYGPAG
jgi:SAM-dependent methyltransferase